MSKKRKIKNSTETPACKTMGFPQRTSYLSRLIRFSLITGGVLLAGSHAVSAQEYFNPALLSVAGEGALVSENTDLSHFEAGGQAPGDYRVTVYVNNQYIGDREINFASDAQGKLAPQLTPAEYRQLGLRVDAVPELTKMADDAQIGDIRTFIPTATRDFRFAEQRLDLTFPQMLMQRRAQGEVDPSTWDQGIPAALLNYAITGNRTRTQGDAGRGVSNALYANLRGGLNLGAWRLRSYATYQQRSDTRSGSSSDFQVISSYLQRDIHAIKGQAIVGDSATPGEVFDSVQFQGGQLVSDEGMLPNSLSGYAPIIRGVSESGAEVTIRQNDSVIYQAYVPPGPFEINDLYPATLSGDLQVTVKENDGSERTFTQPYSSVAIMQREGQLKYAFTAGRLRDVANAASRPTFVQGTLIYGLPHNMTVYGGLQLAQQYAAGSAGIGASLGPLGALSADVTQANATLPDGQKSQGQSYRLRYSHSIAEIGTSVSLAAYRYSTEGYYNLLDAITGQESEPNRMVSSRYRPRGEFQLSINQALGDAGSMYVSGSQRDFWSKAGVQRSWSLGYNNNLWGVSYGLSFSQSQDTDSGRQDRRIGLNASIPLGRWLAGNDAYAGSTMMLNYGLVNSQGQGSSQQVGVSGAALQDNQLNYNLSQTLGHNSNSTNLSSSYRGASGVVSAGYNRSASQEQLNYGIRGGIVAHPYGVTLSQELGETVALVRAPGASDIKVRNQTGLTTDWRGYAIMPWATPYRRSEISLEPKGLKPDVALNQTSTAVTPTRGAVVLADFPTQRGRQVMMTLRRASGTFIPFGAIATLVSSDDSQPNTGIVGDEGLLFMSGMPDDGTLYIQWGKDSDSRCRVAFRLPEANDAHQTAPQVVQGVCQKA